MGASSTAEPAADEADGDALPDRFLRVSRREDACFDDVDPEDDPLAEAEVDDPADGDFPVSAAAVP
ncbi:hypothetical protein ACQ86B_01650 [Mycolicibacterium aichiense]|uniref:hypothetical protein n=1 Tax=Mycolicibacterium aichiense TaxID=1799 RepID=UPI003D67EDBB